MSILERAKRLDFEEAIMALCSSICFDIGGNGGDNGVGKVWALKEFEGLISSGSHWEFSAMAGRWEGLQLNPRAEVWRQTLVIGKEGVRRVLRGRKMREWKDEGRGMLRGKGKRELTELECVSLMHQILKIVDSPLISPGGPSRLTGLVPVGRPSGRNRKRGRSRKYGAGWNGVVGAVVDSVFRSSGWDLAEIVLGWLDFVDIADIVLGWPDFVDIAEIVLGWDPSTGNVAGRIWKTKSTGITLCLSSFFSTGNEGDDRRLGHADSALMGFLWIRRRRRLRRDLLQAWKRREAARDEEMRSDGFRRS
ncbi:hypothetical protein ACLOJK_026448 [Asimina triloba]